ncbi:MAG: hypothetical protein JWM11_7880 [Planctomycetaceae bacterium]|nr:hypothetical protein [Planctomycetaceae bacterium]
MSDSPLLGVLPILPTASSLLAVVLASAIGLFATLASLRMSAVRTLLRGLWRQKPGIIVVSLLGVLVYQVAGRLGHRSSSTVQHGFTVGSWPVYRGTTARHGHADMIRGPVRGGIQWSAAADYDFFSSPAIVGEQIIAVGSKGDSARFFCWNAATGEQVWSLASPGYRATLSSPVIDQGFLFCGEGLHQTTDSRLVCWQLDGPKKPKLNWQFATQSHIECTPAVIDGRVYFGAGDDGIYCLELQNETASGFRVVWHVSGAQYADAETALAVHQGRVYVGLGFGGEALCVLDAVTGREIQRIKLPFPSFSPPAIHEGRLYLGMGRTDYTNYRNGSPGEVWCLDLKTLETVWKISTPSAVLAAIAVHQKQVHFSTVNGQLFVADSQGQITARWNAGAPVLTAPAVTDRMIYCVSCDGLLHGLNQRLERVWSVRLGAPGDYISSPVVFGGRVYVGTPNDGLVCVGESSINETGEDSTCCRSQANSSIPRALNVAWTLAGPAPEQPAEVTAPPTVTSKDLFVPMSSKTWAGLVCAAQFESDAARILWVLDADQQTIQVSPCVRGSQVICLCGKRGESGRLIGIDRESGQALWNHELIQIPNWLQVDSDSIFLQSNVRQLARLGPYGESLWQTEIGQLDHPVQVHGEMLVAAAADPSQLVALDRLTGQILWSVPLLESPVSAPVVLKKQVLIATSTSIELRSLLNGTLQESLKDWSGLVSMTVEGNHLIGTTSSNELLIGLVNSRKVPRRIPRVNSRIGLLSGIDALAYVSDAGQLMRISLDGNDAKECWFETAAKDRITISPVLLDEHVYVPVTGTGLICLKPGSSQ